MGQDVPYFREKRYKDLFEELIEEGVRKPILLTPIIRACLRLVRVAYLEVLSQAKDAVV